MFMTGPQNLVMGFHLNPRARGCAGARGQRPGPAVPLSFPRAGHGVWSRMARGRSEVALLRPTAAGFPIIGGTPSDAWRTMPDVSRTADGPRAGLRRSGGRPLSQHG